MSQQVSETDATEESFVTFCARHPKEETALRCGRCETPICPKCSIPTPVGARCPTCAQVKRFVPVVNPLEMARAIVVTLAVVILVAGVLQFIPFFGLLGTAALGYLAGWLFSNQVRKRRGVQPAAIAVVLFLLGYLIAPLVLGVAGGGLPLELLPRALVAIVVGQGLSNLLGVALGGFLAWMAAR